MFIYMPVKERFLWIYLRWEQQNDYLPYQSKDKKFLWIKRKIHKEISSEYSSDGICFLKPNS